MSKCAVTLQYSSLPERPRWARWLMRPLGWPFYGLCGVALLVFLWKSLLPNVIPPLEFLGVAALILGPLWILRLVIALVLRRIYHHRDPLMKRFLGRFAWPLLLPPVMVLLLATGWMPHLGFWLARPAMNRLVEEVEAIEAARVPPATQPTYHGTRRVGPYVAGDVKYYPDSGTIAFFIKGGGQGFTDYAPGFAYSPKRGTKPKPGGFRGGGEVERQLDDHWWSTVWSW